LQERLTQLRALQARKQRACMNVIAREREIDTCRYTPHATPSHRGSAARARKDGAEAAPCSIGTGAGGTHGGTDAAGTSGGNSSAAALPTGKGVTAGYAACGKMSQRRCNPQLN